MKLVEIHNDRNYTKMHENAKKTLAETKGINTMHGENGRRVQTFHLRIESSENPKYQLKNTADSLPLNAHLNSLIKKTATHTY